MRRRLVIAGAGALALALGASPASAGDCNDGIDNDGDGFVDYREDPGCDGRNDSSELCDPGDDTWPDEIPWNFELGEEPACLPCDNGLDDDGDGSVDLADYACATFGFGGGSWPWEPTLEGDGPLCQNGADDDGDGFADLEDPGCTGEADEAETDPSLVCDDGETNDFDPEIDSADPGCDGPLDPTETDPSLVCDDGVDNDGDGLTDLGLDPGCLPYRHASLSEEYDCADGLDNDGDGRVDGLDRGCGGIGPHPTQHYEDPACEDGLDNDGDGLVDDEDGGCLGLRRSPSSNLFQAFHQWTDTSEAGDGSLQKMIHGNGGGGACGLGAAQALPLVAAVFAFRRRRRSTGGGHPSTRVRNALLGAAMVVVSASAAPTPAEARALSNAGVIMAHGWNDLATTPATIVDDVAAQATDARWFGWRPPKVLRWSALPFTAPGATIVAVGKGLGGYGWSIGAAALEVVTYSPGSGHGRGRPLHPSPDHVWVAETAVLPSCDWPWADDAPRCLP